MNYVSVLMAAVALFALIYWYVAGRYYYVGPRVNAQIIMGVEGAETKGSPSASSEDKRPGELEARNPPGELPGQGRTELISEARPRELAT